MRRRAIGLLTVAVAATGLATWSCSDPVAPANTGYGLRIWAEVVPETVHVGDTTGVFVVRVLEMNPGSQLIVIPAPKALVINANPARGSGFDEQTRISCPGNPFNCGPSMDAIRYVPDSFPPVHEYADSKVLSLKDWARGGWPLVPGTYFVRAWYRGQEGDSARLVLVP